MCHVRQEERCRPGVASRSECGMCIFKQDLTKIRGVSWKILSALRLEVVSGWIRSWRSMLGFCVVFFSQSGHERLERFLSGSGLIP